MQEPHTITPQVTNVLEVAPKKAKTIGEDKVETQSQIGQIDSSAPPAQVQCAIQSNEAEMDKSK